MIVYACNVVVFAYIFMVSPLIRTAYVYFLFSYVTMAPTPATSVRPRRKANGRTFLSVFSVFCVLVVWITLVHAAEGKCPRFCFQ